MPTIDRRTFLKMAGAPAIAAALPIDLSKALAIPANNEARSIDDVEHVIFLMQENRSFDHYFGTLRGVRGFADPHPVTLPSGRSVWHQPDGSGELLPFRPDVPDLGQTFLPDPPHGWNDGHAAWNGGRFDQWVSNKGVTAMTYHSRADLPYQYALADAFTVCDNYYCSLLGPTDPNRYHMWTGWVGNDGAGGGPVITNAEAGYDWSTYPERLERNGITWKVYQDVGVGLTAEGFWGWTADPYIGNYGDNSLLYFHQYQNAQPGTPLADRAKTGTEIRMLGRNPESLLADFRADVEGGRLPQVSWIVAPEAYSEHPNWQPDYGSWYVSQVIDILAAQPDVWSRMALFITYDEEGGFFDHLVPPTPPQTRAQGLSTVPTTNEIYPGDADHPAGPARFARHRPDLIESNVTPWRRAVVGDLTSAFDFKTPNRMQQPQLPDTDDFKPDDLIRFPDQVPVPPADPRLPSQELGVRPARAIPYMLHADGQLTDQSFRIDFRNSGGVAAVFQVRSASAGQDPRTYTVEPGKQLSDAWAVAGYDLTVHGPNGFFRRFVAADDAVHLQVTATYDQRDSEIALTITNRDPVPAVLAAREGYAGSSTKLSLRPGQTRTQRWSLARTRGWYDLTISVAGDMQFQYRYAGHLENGRDSISDPAMGGLVPS